MCRPSAAIIRSGFAGAVANPRSGYTPPQMPAAVAPAPLAVPAADAPVAGLPGVGPRQAQRLARLGVGTVRDLLFHLPRRYEDTRDVRPLAELHPGEEQTVYARVRNVSSHRSPRKRMVLVEASLEDGGHVASAVWFNQPFLARQIHSGDELLLSGKVKLGRGGLVLQNPEFERASGEQRHVGRLAPVYPETEGVSSRWLRSRIEPLLPVADALEDPLPPQLLRSHDLPRLAAALRQVHFPDDPARLELARRRIAFEEMFLLQLAAQRARRRRLAGSGVAVAYDVEVARRFVASLPFRLTEGQRVAAHEILTDMAGTGSMNRLLQGDVGSGKTVVAAMAALMTHAAGHQTAVMAPTEILARQHHATMEALLAPHGVSSRLLVGSTPARARREVLVGVAAGHDTVLIGTHALIEEAVVLADLGLVVVDEQHRFGVAQRQQLRRKGALAPNFLAMTATPIPRSLSLTLYGDVDLSELREMPPGRIPVETRVVAPHQRPEAYDFVRAQVAEGRQAFVICPLIEESDKLGVKSATEEYERLRREVFPELRVELLHGRMPGREKEERMGRFAAGEADLLVSTSVVEVGVDVPNATIMFIEGAERFGLASLHQFRGRVGRGEHASVCLLFQGSPDEEGSKRLEAVAQTRSGFDLAEADLRLRGPGDVVGLRQHGLPEVRVADLLDTALLEEARRAAGDWLDADPELVTHDPLHRAMNGYRAVFDLD
ncbi:MAG: ATP-dependent DNA helicase RecG [Chloroflexi bacterium]|nr:MAG: ATP-dependent DNA helicase RecG [Chloroflexota bacterium]